MTATVSTDLATIETLSGTADDGPDAGAARWRGFVTVTAVAVDGSRLAGQVDPATCRELALSFLEAAEAAEQDAAVFAELHGTAGIPIELVAAIVTALRNRRTR